MKINHILCDMDGVLVDFFSAALALFDFDPANYPTNEWDMARVIGVSDQEFWSRIESQPTFWLDLKPYPWARDLIDLIRHSGVSWSIATHPRSDGKCLAQKLEWMHRFIAPGFDSYMMGKQKHLLAGPGRLLIDDAEHNINGFRRCGGTAIVFPQRWNHWHVYADNCFEVVKERLQMELAQ